MHGRCGWRRMLIAIAAIAVIVVLILPSTREVSLDPLNFGASSRHLTRDELATFVRRHRSEPGPRIAAALALVPGGADPDEDSRETWRRIVAAMEELAAELPTQPAIRAAAISAYCGPASGRSVLDVRRESDPPPWDDGSERRRVVARLLTHADAGQRSDPQNAFFPAMRSLALYAIGDKAGSLRALHEAAQANEWRDYVADETVARWVMRRELTGLARVWDGAADLASARFAHYARLRSLGTLAAHEAAGCELAGDAAGGAAIRADALRVGGLVRAESSTFVGTFAGIAIARRAISQPDDRASLRAAAIQERGEAAWDRRLAGRYVRYLHAHNLPQYQQAVQTEAAAWADVRDVVADSYWFLPNLLDAVLWRGLILYLLLAALWFAILDWWAGGAADRLHVKAGARWALIVILILGVAVLVPMMIGLVYAEFATRIPHPVADGPRTGLALVVTQAVLAGLAALALVWFLSRAILRASRRASDGGGAAAWLRATAGPLALLHVILWAAAIGSTAYVEQSLWKAMSQAATHEGRCLASRRGIPWPDKPAASEAPGPRLKSVSRGPAATG